MREGLIDIVILGDGRRSEGERYGTGPRMREGNGGFCGHSVGVSYSPSGLELYDDQRVSPVLGVTKLPLNNPVNWMLKRALDVVGAMVGLVFTRPSNCRLRTIGLSRVPGPIFYRQIRVGRRGRHFQIIKIRSMKLSAEKEMRRPLGDAKRRPKAKHRCFYATLEYRRASAVLERPQRRP